MDITIGRKGLLGYLKALAGSNAVKVIPANGSASESQATGKRLKVICGASTSYIADDEWVKTEGKGKATPFTFCEVRVSPSHTVKPNLGATELAEALNRVLPFTARDDDRPILQTVQFVAREGKLTLTSADGFRLAVVSLDYEDGEGEALIHRDNLRGIANALRRAKRVRIGFEGNGSLDGKDLTLDTELIRYKWSSASGTYPDWRKLIPTEASTEAHFDTVEAIKAIRSLKALASSKAYPIDLSLDNGYIVMANPDDKGQTAIPADIDGKPIKVRLDGGYLAEVLRACGGMADFKLTTPYSPVLFEADGFQLVLMPMITAESTEAQKREAEAKRQAVAEAEVITEAEAVVEAEGKPKRSRRRDKVLVA